MDRRKSSGSFSNMNMPIKNFKSFIDLRRKTFSAMSISKSKIENKSSDNPTSPTNIKNQRRVI